MDSYLSLVYEKDETIGRAMYAVCRMCGRDDARLSRFEWRITLKIRACGVGF